MNCRFSASGKCVVLVTFLALCVGTGACQELPATSTSLPSSDKPLMSEEEIRELLWDEFRADNVWTLMGDYRCQSMATVVNGLRHLGKDKALEILAELNSRQPSWPNTQLRVIYICRVLFVVPKEGWTEPWTDYRMKVPNYLVDTGGYSKEAKLRFPLYPIALSDGVPFLLSSGYSTAAAGKGPPIPNEAKTTIDRCRTLDMIPADIPIRGFVQAAQKLVDSDAYKRLLDRPGDEDKDAKAKFKEELQDRIMNEADGRWSSRPPASSATAPGRSP